MRHLLALLAVLFAFAAPLRADLLAVANRGGSTITVVDPATMTVLGSVTVGPDPHEIAIGSDGRAYVSNYGNGNGQTLSVVDLKTRTKIKDISIAPLTGPHGIVAAAGKIWFTAEKTQSIGRYDPATDRVDWVGRTGQDGSHMLAVRADGSAAYTGNIAQSTASLIPVSGAESTAKLNVPVVNGPEGVGLSPDGKELWLGSRTFNGMSVIDVATEKVVATVAPGTFAYRVVFTPDGKHVLVPRQGEVAVFDAAERKLVKTIAVSGQPFSIVALADNKTIFVAGGNPNQVVKLDLTTGATLGTVAMPAIVDGLAYQVTGDKPAEPRKKRRTITKGN